MVQQVVLYARAQRNSKQREQPGERAAARPPTRGPCQRARALIFTSAHYPRCHPAQGCHFGGGCTIGPAGVTGPKQEVVANITAFDPAGGEERAWAGSRRGRRRTFLCSHGVSCCCEAARQQASLRQTFIYGLVLKTNIILKRRIMESVGV